MFELEKTMEVEELINITRSDSGISGPKLAKAHIRLGELLGKCISIEPNETTVVALMRGGIFFAQGIYFALGCKFMTYDVRSGHFERPDTRSVILVDSVVNTGNTIKKIWEPEMMIACCVINKDAVPDFYEQLYTVRISENRYVGSNTKLQHGETGPDTTLRLFNQI